jgi:hypothetical protein
MALLLAAAWVRWRGAYPVRMLMVSMGGAVALFLCHLMGLMFFAVLLGAEEAASALKSGRAGKCLARGAVLLAVFATPAVLYWLSPLETVAGDPVYHGLAAKLGETMVPFTNYVRPLDVAVAAVVGSGLLAGLVTRRLIAAPGPALALCLLFIGWAAAPFGFKGTSHLDERFVTMAGLMVFACLRPVRLPRGIRPAVVVGLAALLTLRMGIVAEAWWEHRTDVAGLRAAIAGVEPGSRVFVTSVSPAEAPAYWRVGPAARRLSDGTRTETHMPALLLIERRAWWPFLFDNPSQQPVVQLEPYRRLARAVGSMVPHHVLDGAGINRVCGFDYVLLLEAGAEPALDDFGSGRLGLVVADDFAALFRVYPQFLRCGAGAS